MLKKVSFSLFFIIFLFVSPLFALEQSKDISPDNPVISSLPEEKLNNVPKIIENYNSNEIAENAVQRHINYFTGKIKERFSIWLARSGKYLELMKSILKENNVPEDIVFLPLIESGFNANAYSPARAVGYWQFIASTAKNYGLEINWWKDERKDPVKSTIAAANYLKDLYKMFGSWNLAMAAYNAGEGKIQRALDKSNADDFWSLLSTRYIRNETKDYVPKFIAASMIATDPQKFGFENLEYHKPLNYDLVTVKSPVDLEVIAEASETSIETIKELNPELRRWCTPPYMPEYTIRIPKGKKEIFQQNISQIPEDRRFVLDKYTVKKGDTFKKIAKKTGVPEEVIFDLNDMESIMPLKEGKTIYIPPKWKIEMDHDDKIISKKIRLKVKKDIKKKSGTKVSFKNNKLKKPNISKSIKTASIKTKQDKS
ncbi:MAG: transglycosylase SLT domain-containing protein [Nitrospirae bacterium]|jgi:membrane-bound lytic murein transglycosylase D|nr:transglycosylase SLT domain-containing protein [Nitrospirota bacterium]